MEKFDCHESKECRAWDEENENTGNVRKGVASVTESTPDLTRLGKVDDQKRPQRSEIMKHELSSK